MPATLHTIPARQQEPRASEYALKPGRATNTLVLASESWQAFQTLLDSLTAEWQPATDSEFLLVEEMAAAAWRQRRAWAIESAHFDLAMVRNEPAIRKQFDAIDHATRTTLAHQRLTEDGHALALQDVRRGRGTAEPQQKSLEIKIVQNNFPPSGLGTTASEGHSTSEPKEQHECPGPSNQPPNHSSALESN